MRFRMIAAACVLACTALSAHGQDAADAQKKLLAKRSAEADAYRKLAECVYGLQINARTYVKDFVTESDEIKSDVDTFIRGIRLGTPTWYEDGSCEVPAEVTVEKVIETLRETHSRHYKGDRVTATDFESMTQKIEKKIIKAVGMGAPREDIPRDLPEGVAEQLGPPPGGKTESRPPIPDIWLKVGPQARLMAIRAARMDAMRRMAERIKGLRLTSRTQVRDFVAESDVITTEMNTSLVGAEEIGTFLHHDELIAEVTLRVPTEQVITTIKSLHSRHYKGDDVKGMDIEKIVKEVVKKDFEATGMGVPPQEQIRKYEQVTHQDVPDWAAEVIEVDGEGTDPEITTAQGKLRAARAAELDAKRRLAEHIAGLQLTSETVVKEFVTQHDAISTQVDAIMVDAVVSKTRFTEQTAVVTVTVPGMRVWRVFHEEIRRTTRSQP
ncbi:MAG: hypothetical protein CHACPFDD_03199 [Phycisphaerae bacterium]|nr:hypothetical protein [Phycisphaerae bacterium]